MKILVIGRSGQVAGELQRRCPDGWRMTALGREQADLSDPQACASAVLAHDVDAIINAALPNRVRRFRPASPSAAPASVWHRLSMGDYPAARP